MAGLGVARMGDQDLLAEAGADLVVTTLDDVSLHGLAEGRLRERRAAAELRGRYAERPPSVWTLVYDGFDPARQGLREALCALGNGYFVTRGALPEAHADGVHYPGTYVAGLYDRAVTDIAGRMVENEDLVNLPNWLPLSFRIAGGEWFDAGAAELLEHRLELDLHDGTLTRQLRFADQQGHRTRVVQRREETPRPTGPRCRRGRAQPSMRERTWAGLSGVRRTTGSRPPGLDPLPRKACSTALAMTAGPGMAPPSPTPLRPSGLSGDGVSTCSRSILGTSPAVGTR
jgi:Glycosyl hydrolase family 65, N-terminal domain